MYNNFTNDHFFEQSKISNNIPITAKKAKQKPKKDKRKSQKNQNVFISHPGAIIMQKKDRATVYKTLNIEFLAISM